MPEYIYLSIKPPHIHGNDQVYLMHNYNYACIIIMFIIIIILALLWCFNLQYNYIIIINSEYLATVAYY